MNTLRSFAFLCIIIALIIWGHPGSFIFLFAVVIVSLTTFLLNKRNHPYGLLEKFGIDIRFQSAVFLIIITIFSFWTASRYFYADDQIYKNVDHHALGLNGFQINDSQVMLVTNDSTALFDEEITPGKLNLCFQSDSCSTLQYKGFSRPIYVSTPGTQEYYLGNANNMPSFHSQFSLISNAEHQKLSMRIEYNEKNVWDLICSVLPFKGTEKKKKEILYIFTLSGIDGNEEAIIDTSLVDKDLQRGYALRDMIPVKIAQGLRFSVDGITLVREHYIRSESPKDCRSQPFYLGLYTQVYQNDNSLDFENDNNKKYRLADYQETEGSIQLSPSSYFYVDAFGKYVTPRMKVLPHSKQIHFSLPYYKPLKSDEPCGKDMTFYITSDKNHIVDLKLSNNYLFDILHKQSNINHIGGSLSYNSGYTEDSLVVRWSNRFIPSETEKGVYLLKADNEKSGVSWMFKVTNFRETTPFQPEVYFIYLFIICTLACFSLLITPYNIQHGKISHRHNTPYAELSLWTIIIVLFTVRFFFNWRVSVFPPLEGVSSFEWNNIINYKPWWWAIPCFQLAIIVYKIGYYLKNYTQSRLSRGINKACQKLYPRKLTLQQLILICWVICLSSAFIGHFFFGGYIRYFLIALPLLLFFIIEYLIAELYKKSYNGELPRHSFANYNLTLWHFFNYLIFLGPVLLFDSGYAIMFIFFVLLRTIFLFRDYQWACIEANEVPIYGNFYRKLLEKQVILEERIKELSDSGDTNEKDRLQKTLKDIKRQRLVKFNIIYIIIGVVFVLACILAPHILTMTYLGAILFTVLITGIIYFWVNACCKVQNLKFNRNWRIGVIAFTIVISGLGCYKIFIDDSSMLHMRYRSMVLVKDWNSIMQEESMDNENKINRFLQASENKWIIDYFLDNANDLSESRFKMLPHSKLGALWGAQMTDLTLIRFGIAEHSELFFWGIMALFFLLFFFTYTNPIQKKKTINRNIAVSIILLLCIQCIFIWMSVTNQFIFFGQDFPMISIQSNFSLVYIMLLVGMVIASIFPESQDMKPEKADAKYNEGQVRFNMFSARIGKHYTIFLIILVGVLAIARFRLVKSDSTYNIDLSMNEPTLELVNEWLNEYQISQDESYNKKYANSIVKGGGKSPACISFFKAFESNITKVADLEEIQDVANQTGIGTSIQEVLSTINADAIDSLNICITQDMPTNTGTVYLLKNDRLNNHIAQYKRIWRSSNIKMETYLQDNATYLRMSYNSQKNPLSDVEKNELEFINRLFLMYQQRSGASRISPMAKEYARNLIRDGDVSTFFYDFDKAYKLRDRLDNDSINRKYALTKFGKGLIYAFLNSYCKNNVYSNIIFMRTNRNTGMLELALHRNYYMHDNPIDSRNYWKGDLTAASAYHNETVFLDSKKQVEVCKADFGEIDIPIEGGKLWQIPTTWTPQSQQTPIVILTATPGRKMQLTSYYQNNYDVYEGDGNYSVMRVLPGDKLGNHQLLFETKEYVAKNIWLNGHHTFIYPQKYGFYWAKPYSDFVSKVYTRKQKQTAQDTPEQKLKIESYQTTLDMRLSQELYAIMDNLKKEADMSVIVANADGHIKAMVDFKDNPQLRLDPNDEISYSQWAEKLNMLALGGEERDLFGNLNLFPLRFGPGSSLKPMTFAAVTSGYNIGWEGFRLVGMEAPHNNASHYAGKTLGMKTGWRSLPSDEPGPGEAFNIEKYIYRSSNFFNSVMVYIGSFDASRFNKEFCQVGRADGADNTLFTVAHNIKKESFPVVEVNHRRSKFNQILEPTKEKNPLIAQQFEQNFTMPARSLFASSKNSNILSYRKSATNGLDADLRRYAQDYEISLVQNESWTAPEPSFIDFELRKNPTEVNYASAIRGVTLGMRRFMDITPLKMAEMFGKLASMNTSFHLTVNPEYHNEVTDFSIDDSWGSEDKYTSFLGNNLFKGMASVIDYGTATYLKGIKKQLHDENRNVFMYAKTGTINDSSINEETGLLAVIISDTDLQTANKEQRRTAKFYVIYMFMDNIKGNGKAKQDLQKGCVQAVVNSKHFKNYITGNGKKKN